ncbi:MAG: hypothetical protein EA401_13095 [Planctomycetota bacterium]|nr:MAG: hypothetical protein EA401_13095 [Planctomycetota bacterium]
MTIRMNFNNAAIRSQLNLTTVNRLLGSSIERLSSGVRINRSADDPAAMSIANRMRYQLNSLNTAVSNSENGINMLQTAEGAMDELANALNTMRTLALDAANEAVNDPARLTALQNDFDAITASITRLAKNATFGSIPLLDGSQSQNTLGRVARNGTPPAITSIEALKHDVTAMPAGIQEGSPIALDPLTSPLSKERIQVSLNDGGAPAAANATLNGVEQNGQTLNVSQGHQVTVNGPSGSKTFTLNPNTTIQSFVDQVNESSDLLGASASYNPSDGQLVIESGHFGHGSLSITSSDMSGTGVGLLDGNTADPDSNPLAVPREAHAMTLEDLRRGGAADRDSLMVDVLADGFGSFADVDGKRITLYGEGYADSFLLEGTSFDDILGFVDEHADWFQGSVVWDAGNQELTVSDDDTPPNVEVLSVDNATSLHEVMEFIATHLNSPQVQYNAGSGTISITDPDPGGETAELSLESTTVGDFIDWVNDRQDKLGASASIDGAGRLAVTAHGDPIILHSEDLSQFGVGYGILDGNSAEIEDAAAARVAPLLYEVGLTHADSKAPAIASDPISSLRLNGIALDDAIGKTITFDDGSVVAPDPLPVFEIIDTTTSIQDLIDFVNTNPDINAQADLHNGQLRIRALGSQLDISSDTLSADVENPTRIWDADSRIDTHPSRQLTYTDASGNEQQVTLYQRSGSRDGLGFTNLTGIGEPIYGLRNQETTPLSRIANAGAWSLQMRDMSDDNPGLFSDSSQAHAQRQHASFIQIGANAGDKSQIEISDMRAGALGQSAYRQQVADTSSPNTLLEKGFFSIEDLTQRQALLEGDAQDALAVIDAAIDEVSTMRGRLGAQQASLLEPTVNNLRLGIENLTASESRIRDIDFAEESANFARHQIMYEAATAMLAQANQVPQSILQLLGGR